MTWWLPHVPTFFDGLERGAYDLILADPPWRFRTWNETNQVKSAKNHYDLMDRQDLLDLPVASLASSNSCLVMWATQAQLDEAVELLAAWGFRYKTAGAWAKQSSTGEKWAFGTGYWLRSAAEFYIVGARGNPKVEDRGVRNLIVAPVREHSRKPDRMYEDLESMFPSARKLELFARTRRPGWDCWGNQTEKFQ